MLIQCKGENHFKKIKLLCLNLYTYILRKYSQEYICKVKNTLIFFNQNFLNISCKEIFLLK